MAGGSNVSVTSHGVPTRSAKEEVVVPYARPPVEVGSGARVARRVRDVQPTVAHHRLVNAIVDEACHLTHVRGVLPPLAGERPTPHIAIGGCGLRGVVDLSIEVVGV